MTQQLVLPAAAAGAIASGDDLRVNRMGYGAMRITGPGVWGPPPDKQEALATLRKALEIGVNLIDTADSYGPATSEELIAEALYPYPANLVIATKGGWERPGPNQWTHNSSPKHLFEALEGSLKRLRLERIDIYQLHAPDNVIPFEVSVEALARLRNQGKIRHIGLSNVTREHVERARKIVPIVSVQNRYSFADRESDFIVDYCEANGIAFFPWAPLGQARAAHEAVVLADIVPRRGRAEPRTMVQDSGTPVYESVPAAATHSAENVAPQFTATFTEDKAGFYINGEKFDMDAPPMLTVDIGSISIGAS